MERLMRQNLHGVWAAIATPFDQNDQFDEDVFRENVRRLQWWELTQRGCWDEARARQMSSFPDLVWRD
jgi:hypothetical protein